MIELIGDSGKIELYHGNKFLGTLELYDNPHHATNVYVNLKIENPDPSTSLELFDKLRKLARKPLQVMIDSSEISMMGFLTAGGFTCKRKCYEVDVSARDYCGSNSTIQLETCTAGTRVYEECCRKMYQHYVDTHKSVNPWTSNYEVFRDVLPDKVIYSMRENEVSSIAFVEENEIAYVSGSDKERFLLFAKALVNSMLMRYDRIFFEADNTDWVAMILRSLFLSQDDSSYDTYILENRIGEHDSRNDLPLDGRM